MNLRFSLTPQDVAWRYATSNRTMSLIRAQAELKHPAHQDKAVASGLHLPAYPDMIATPKAEGPSFEPLTATIAINGPSATPKTGNYPLSPPPNHANIYTTLGSSPSPYADLDGQIVSLEVCNMNYVLGAGPSKALLFSPPEVLA